MNQSLRVAAPILFSFFLIGTAAGFGQTAHLQMDLVLPPSSESSSLLPDSPSAGFSQAGTAAQQPGTAAQQPGTAAQQPGAAEATASTQETEEQRKAREREAAEAQIKKQEKQRLAGVVPYFATVEGGSAIPLTPRQKFELASHTAIDPFNFGLAFIVAGIGEADDSHQGYHWGAQGYFKRVGATYADSVDGALIGNALMPTIFHQDPRYFRKGTGSIKSRVLYSALSTVICHGDNGHQQFNYSNVAGNLVAGAISNIYYPSNETGFELTITNALVVTAEGAIGAQLLEFSPDLNRALRRRRERKAAARGVTP